MAEDASFLTRKGAAMIRRLLYALVLSTLFIAGFWMLSQTLDAVVVLGRGYVNIPSYPLPVSVWPYHDAAYLLLWISYVGFVLWDIAPWMGGRFTASRTVIALFGFSLLTSGLWLAQDTMNAVLVLGRDFVDYPFLLASPDVHITRDASTLLVVIGFLAYFALDRVAFRGRD
ncbi:MAG TPA: hypothetical protein VJR06_06980 [Nitrososphaerales archaeon]|nr:hypothetical protein [Nitrososphaerales archaeon]